MTTTQESFKMSDDMVLGFYDADGGVLMDVEKKKNGGLVFSVDYYIKQSTSKTDAVVKFAEHFGAVDPQAKDPSLFKHNQSSEVGTKVRKFLLNNNPKNPGRLRDFYISEALISRLNNQTQLSRVGKVQLARLVSNKAVLHDQGASQAAFVGWCEHMSATPSEIKEALLIIDPIVAEIETRLETHSSALEKTTFSDDYVLGSHFGDGSLYVGLTWKPGKNNHRLRCEPEWAISGNYKPYCRAFANTINGGTTKPVDQKQHKFVLGSITNCYSTVLPFFDQAAWMPAYKLDQYTRWRRSILLLRDQEHFTEAGIRELLDLCYGLAEKGARRYTKDQYLEWGLAWVAAQRQKRTPRGQKRPPATRSTDQ